MPPLATQSSRLYHPMGLRVKHTDICSRTCSKSTQTLGQAAGQRRQRGPQHRCSSSAHNLQRTLQGHLVIVRPLERKAQQQFQARSTWLALGKWQVFGIFVDWRVV